jgi:hypothetical protein
MSLSRDRAGWNPGSPTPTASGRDSLDFLADPVPARELQLVAGLQADPHLGAGTDRAPEPHRRVHGDPAAAGQDLGDPRLRHLHRLGERVGGDAGLLEPVADVLAGVDRRQRLVALVAEVDEPVLYVLAQDDRGEPSSLAVGQLDTLGVAPHHEARRRPNLG